MDKKNKIICTLYIITAILQLMVAIINIAKNNNSSLGLTNIALSCTFACLAWMYYKKH